MNSEVKPVASWLHVVFGVALLGAVAVLRIACIFVCCIVGLVVGVLCTPLLILGILLFISWLIP